MLIEICYDWFKLNGLYNVSNFNEKVGEGKEGDIKPLKPVASFVVICNSPNKEVILS